MAAAKTKTKARTLIPLTTYVPQETVDRIAKLQAVEDRRLGQMVRRLIDEALDAREREPAVVK